MEYREELWWILDKERKSYQENIDFVHSLGLKCDCVGLVQDEAQLPGNGKRFEGNRLLLPRGAGSDARVVKPCPVRF